MHSGKARLHGYKMISMFHPRASMSFEKVGVHQEPEPSDWENSERRHKDQPKLLAL